MMLLVLVFCHNDRLVTVSSVTYFSLHGSVICRLCWTLAGNNRLSLAEWHGSILSGFRPATFVWHAVQTTSAFVSDTPAGCSSVTVCNCWRPNLRYCWCSAVEQSATRHYRMWHSTTVSSWTQNVLVSTVIPIYCVLVCYGLRFVVHGPCGFYLGHVKNPQCNVM